MVRWDVIVRQVLTDENNLQETDGKVWVLNKKAIAACRPLVQSQGEDPTQFKDQYIWFHMKRQALKLGWIHERGSLFKRVGGKVAVENIEPVAVDEILKPYIPQVQPPEYVPQMCPGGTDIDLLKKSFAEKRHALLEGPTGCGKSTAIDLVHWELKAPMWRMPVHERMEFDDLVGRWVPSDGGWKFVKGPLTVSCEYGMTFVLEEVNMALPGLIAFLNSAMDDTRTVTISQKMQDGSDVAQVIRVHPNFWCVATMNRGYEGTKPINKALARRFKVKLVYGHPKEAEQKLLPQWVRDIAEKLRNKPEVINTPVSFGLLKDLRDNENIFGRQAALWMFLNNFAPEERPEVKEVIFMTTNVSVDTPEV